MVIGTLIFILVNVLIFGVIGWSAKIGISILITLVLGISKGMVIGKDTIINIVENTAKWKKGE